MRIPKVKGLSRSSKSDAKFNFHWLPLHEGCLPADCISQLKAAVSVLGTEVAQIKTEDKKKFIQLVEPAENINLYEKISYEKLRSFIIAIETILKNKSIDTNERDNFAEFLFKLLKAALPSKIISLNIKLVLHSLLEDTNTLYKEKLYNCEIFSGFVRLIGTCNEVQLDAVIRLISVTCKYYTDKEPLSYEFISVFNELQTTAQIKVILELAERYPKLFKYLDKKLLENNYETIFKSWQLYPNCINKLLENDPQKKFSAKLAEYFAKGVSGNNSDVMTFAERYLPRLLHAINSDELYYSAVINPLTRLNELTLVVMSIIDKSPNKPDDFRYPEGWWLEYKRNKFLVEGMLSHLGETGIGDAFHEAICESPQLAEKLTDQQAMYLLGKNEPVALRGQCGHMLFPEMTSPKKPFRLPTTYYRLLPSAIEPILTRILKLPIAHVTQIECDYSFWLCMNSNSAGRKYVLDNLCEFAEDREVFSQPPLGNESTCAAECVLQTLKLSESAVTAKQLQKFLKCYSSEELEESLSGKSIEIDADTSRVNPEKVLAILKVFSDQQQVLQNIESIAGYDIPLRLKIVEKSAPTDIIPRLHRITEICPISDLSNATFIKYLWKATREVSEEQKPNLIALIELIYQQFQNETVPIHIQLLYVFTHLEQTQLLFDLVKNADFLNLIENANANVVLIHHLTNLRDNHTGIQDKLIIIIQNICNKIQSLETISRSVLFLARDLASLVATSFDNIKIPLVQACHDMLNHQAVRNSDSAVCKYYLANFKSILWSQKKDQVDTKSAEELLRYSMAYSLAALLQFNKNAKSDSNYWAKDASKKELFDECRIHLEAGANFYLTNYLGKGSSPDCVQAEHLNTILLYVENNALSDDRLVELINTLLGFPRGPITTKGNNVVLSSASLMPPAKKKDRDSEGDRDNILQNNNNSK